MELEHADYKLTIRVTTERHLTPTALRVLVQDTLLSTEGVVGVGLVDVARLMRIPKPRKET